MKTKPTPAFPVQDPSVTDWNLANALRCAPFIKAQEEFFTPADCSEQSICGGCGTIKKSRWDLCECDSEEAP